MAQVEYESTGDRSVRIVYVPDTFWHRFWAILSSLVFHPLTDTVIRTIPRDNVVN